MARIMKTVDHAHWIAQKLQNPKFAAKYLKAARKEEDLRVYRVALKQVIKARRQS